MICDTIQSIIYRAQHVEQLNAEGCLFNLNQINNQTIIIIITIIISRQNLVGQNSVKISSDNVEWNNGTIDAQKQKIVMTQDFSYLNTR